MPNQINAKTCACTSLRSAARTVTQYYDAFLQPSGLQTTQFSLLAALARVESISTTQCAQAMNMDRTTLTRNLDPLLRRGLVARAPGADKRVRALQITEQGRAALAAARPLWAQAQERVVAGMGEARFLALLGELLDLAALIRSERP